jgi:hypothetical protein
MYKDYNEKAVLVRQALSYLTTPNLPRY